MRRHSLNTSGSETINYFLARAVMMTAVAFITYHTIVIFTSEFRWPEGLMAFGLLFAEIFFAMNGVGYAMWVEKSSGHDRSDKCFVATGSSSSVACLIPVCDEPLDVIGETLAGVSGLWYPNKKVYLLDDSSKPEKVEGVAALAKDFGAEVIRRDDRRHFKAGNINNALERIDSDYIAVFDADQRPQPSFITDMVAILDDDPDLAFVQTPQAYSNISSEIAAAASLQNSLFYEYVAEGKDVIGAMFCCGTNFVMRTHALKSVGGFDITSITEDFATTLRLHAAGWRSRFYGTLYVVGLGPENLSSYMKQYSRWATGTLQVLTTGLKLFVRNPRTLTLGQWFEYWLSCSYYLSGPVNLYLLLLPPGYMLLGLTPIRGNPFVYLTLFFSVLFFFWTLFLFSSNWRGYSIRSLVTICARLETCKFHVYSLALLSALLGRQATFKVTEKGGANQMPWRHLSVPLIVLGLNVLAATIGMIRMSVAVHWPTAISAFWAAYNVWMLSALIQYNVGSEEHLTESLQPWESEARA